MANRNQDFERQSGQRGGRDWRGEDENRGQSRWSEDAGRHSSADDDRDSTYGLYGDTDQGESARRAGYGDQNRQQYRGRDTSYEGRPDRYEGYGNFGQGGYGGRQGSGREQEGYRGGNYGEPNYGYGQSAQERGGQGRNQSGGNQGSQGNYGSQGGYGSQGAAGAQGWSGYGQGGRGSSSFGRSQDFGSSSGFGQGGSTYGEYAGYGTSGGWNDPQDEGRQSSSIGGYGAEGQRMGTGQHRGKGPKGYQRSDDRIKEMLCERLHEDPHIDPSEVTINVQGGKITLDGTVDSRHTKNAIEDIAEQLGAQEVQNNLRVQKQGQAGMSQGASAAGKSGAGEEGATATKQKH